MTFLSGLLPCRFPPLHLPAIPPDQLHEPALAEGLDNGLAVPPGNLEEPLGVLCAHGHDEPAAFLQLGDVGLRHLRGRCRGYYRVERGVLRPAECPIPHPYDDVLAAEPFEKLPRAGGYGRYPFHGIDPVGDHRKYRALVAGAGAYLQNLLSPVKRERLGHEGDHVGLRYRLLLAYWQGHSTAGPLGR